MSSNQNPVVAVDHVQKSFGEVKVLRDISLAVNPGEVVAIIGPSGGGKSTLLRCMTLLERVDAGDLTYGDLTCAEDGTYGDKALLAQARQRFGLVFQNYNLFRALLGAEKRHGRTDLRAEARPRGGGGAGAGPAGQDGPYGQRGQGALPSSPAASSNDEHCRALAMNPQVMFFDAHDAPPAPSSRPGPEGHQGACRREHDHGHRHPRDGLCP